MNVAFVVAVLGLAPLVGCRADRSSESRPAPAASTSARTAETRKRVTEAECSRWVEHAVGVLLAELRSAVKECPTAQREAFEFQLDGERATVRRSGLELCRKHLDEDYAGADGACYLAAKTASALAECKLGPMTSPGDSDVAAVVAQMKKQCTQDATPQAR